MRRFRPGACLALSAALAAGCTDSALDPVPTDVGASFARAEGAATPSAAGSNFLVVSMVGSGLPESLQDEVASLGGSVEALYEELGVAVVSGIDGSGANSLRSLKDVAFVEAEPILTLEEPAGLEDPIPADAASSGAHDAADPTTASRFAFQWNMRAIDAPAAWAAGRLGSSDVTVAILDTGIDYLYPDLVGRVDLSRSVSFIPDDDALAAAFFPTRHPITDLHFHGTHVASTVVTNGLIVAGVTSGVTLMGVKVCSVFTSIACPGSAIFAGIVHAVSNGADVVNMSLGGSFTKRDFPGAVSAYQRLFNWANRNGTLIVVSAGNSSSDLDHDGNGFKTYCSVANVVCVSATGPTSGGTFSSGPFDNPDAPAFYTNYGRSAISVAAPGGNVPFVVGACSTSSLVIPQCQGGIFILGVAGTSMAAPHASGVAALIAEDVGRSPAQIRARLAESADDLGQPGTDPFYGKGRVNAAGAVGAN